MLEKVARFIRENNLIEKGSKVLVGVSGGADSVALLLVLWELGEKLGIKLGAAHLNHGIRGESAERDREYVEEFCKKLNVPFFVGYADIPTLARENSHTLEQEGRIVRYRFLEETMEKFGAACIAVAHHMDDQAESILMHMIRGSGLHGLTGMQCRRGDIIRPLLCVRRSEIEAFLEARGIAYQTDETNLVAEGTRNRLRLDVVPYIEKNINPAFTNNLCTMGSLVSEDDEFLDSLARRGLEKARQGKGYRRAELLKLPSPLLGRAIRFALGDIGAVVDIERTHILRVKELLSAQTGSRADLPGALVRISYELVIFEPAGSDGEEARKEVTLPVPGSIMIGGWEFETLVSDTPAYTKDPFTGYMDMDRIPGEMTLRKRRPGDRFHPLGAPGRRKLKEYFIDKKVPREDREIYLVAAEDEVLFIPGYTVSQRVRVNDETKRVLMIRCKNITE